MNYGLIDDKKKYDADNSLSMLDITVQTVCRCFELNQDDVSFDNVHSIYLIVL